MKDDVIAALASQGTLEDVQSKAAEILDGLGFSGGGIESTVVEMLQEIKTSNTPKRLIPSYSDVYYVNREIFKHTGERATFDILKLTAKYTGKIMFHVKVGATYKNTGVPESGSVIITANGETIISFTSAYSNTSNEYWVVYDVVENVEYDIKVSLKSPIVEGSNHSASLRLIEVLQKEIYNEPFIIEEAI